MPKISIIIPIYNVEEYLFKSLNSVLNQTFKDFEVIMVNDGSTDSSVEIAQTFVEKDSRFQLVNQENKGLSGARNTGLKSVNGDFVFYLDSDDYLTPNALELLFNASQKYEADAVQGNFYYDYSDYLLLNKQQDENEIVYSRDEAMMALLEHKIVLNFAWGKLIKKDLALQFQFPEGKYFEDTFWMAQLIHCCTKYIALNKPILYYLQRNSGISGGFSIRNLDQLELEVKRLEFIKSNYSEKHYQKALKLLIEKIIQHNRLIQYLNTNDALIYKEKLDAITRTLRLNTRISWWEHLNTLIKKITQRLFKSPTFIKIPKTNKNE